MSMTAVRRLRSLGEGRLPEPSPTVTPRAASDGCIPIEQVRWRCRARVTGRVRSLRVQPWADVPTLQCTLVDPTGGITVVFLGRRHVAGIEPGTRMTVEGVAGMHDTKLAILNPDYSLLER